MALGKAWKRNDQVTPGMEKKHMVNIVNSLYNDHEKNLESKMKLKKYTKARGKMI